MHIGLPHLLNHLIKNSFHNYYYNNSSHHIKFYTILNMYVYGTSYIKQTGTLNKRLFSARVMTNRRNELDEEVAAVDMHGLDVQEQSERI